MSASCIFFSEILKLSQRILEIVGVYLYSLYTVTVFQIIFHCFFI